MIAPWVDNMVPFNLVVYTDGQAIAEVSGVLQVTTAELRDLVNGVATDLAGLPPTVAPRGNARVMDAGVTVLGLRTSAGAKSVSADALDELRDAHAYPASLYAARDLLSSLADRVMRDGTDYVAERIRLFAQPAAGQDTGGSPGTWPHGMAVPQTTDRFGIRYVDLAGPEVATVIASVRSERVDWAAFQSPTGEVMRLSWRYLLPNE
jgi:hypothetical protein